MLSRCSVWPRPCLAVLQPCTGRLLRCAGGMLCSVGMCTGLLLEWRVRLLCGGRMWRVKRVQQVADGFADGRAGHPLVEQLSRRRAAPLARWSCVLRA